MISATATSAATTFVASPSPDATGGSADHFSAPAPPTVRDTTATDASTTETPTVPPLPPFHVPAGANDGTPAASSSPGVALGVADGVMAVAASATEADLDVETAPPAVDMDTWTSASAVTDDTAPARKRKQRYSIGLPAKRCALAGDQVGQGHAVGCEAGKLCKLVDTVLKRGGASASWQKHRNI